MLLAVGGVPRAVVGMRDTSSPPDSDVHDAMDAQHHFWNDAYTSGENHSPKEETESTNTRRLIKVDFSKLKMFDDDEDDDEDDDPASEISPRKKTAPWHRTAYDLATQCPSRRASMRRHTFASASNNPESGSQSLPQSRPQSRGPTLSSASSETDSNLGCTLPEMSWSRSSLQDELLQSVGTPTGRPQTLQDNVVQSLTKNWQQAMECLSLTLEEIVHIRSVLTKAELESLPVEGQIKQDVERKKVCFLCLKTRFGILGPWGQICKLCQRTVCSKCFSKMRIPTEHFSRVPVFALSPGLSSPDEESKESFPRSLVSRLLVPEMGRNNSVGSAPSSPSLARAETMSAPPSGMSTSMTGSIDGPQSLPATSPASTTSDRRSIFTRSKTLGRPDPKKEKLKGLEMIVCHDCKTMVIQIIKSSRTNRNNAIRNLTLNLSPVY